MRINGLSGSRAKNKGYNEKGEIDHVKRCFKQRKH